MTRWADLDRAKGLAIILVVFGHLVAREDPVGVAWYGPLRAAVYLFHMPFFLYLSGFVAVLSGVDRQPPDWIAFLGRQARRLLLPFLGFGLLILAGKLALGRVVAVDNLPAGLSAGLTGLVWETGRSPATSVWYLLVLFVYVVALPVLVRHLGMAGLLGLGLMLFILPVPAVAYLDRICGYFVFFAAGVAAARSGRSWLDALDRWRWPMLGLFSVLLALAWSGLESAGALPGGRAAWLLGLGLLSMPALHGLMRAWSPALLGWLGQRVFAIYLLNTICIGLAKAALTPVLGWSAAHFTLCAVLLMAAGLGGPLAVAAAARPVLQRGPRRRLKARSSGES